MIKTLLQTYVLSEADLILGAPGLRAPSSPGHLVIFLGERSIFTPLLKFMLILTCTEPNIVEIHRNHPILVRISWRASASWSCVAPTIVPSPPRKRRCVTKLWRDDPVHLDAPLAWRY